MSGKSFNLRERLLAMRRETALHQEETAELLDLPYKTYQAIEGGRRTAIRLDTLEKIADGYDLPLWELFHPKQPKLSEKCGTRVIQIMQRRQIRRS